MVTLKFSLVNVGMVMHNQFFLFFFFLAKGPSLYQGGYYHGNQELR